MADLEAQRARAERFERWAKEDGLYDAFDTLRQEYLELIAASKPTDVTGRERLYWAVNVVDRVRHHVTEIVGTGKIASKELERLKAGKPGRF